MFARRVVFNTSVTQGTKSVYVRFPLGESESPILTLTSFVLRSFLGEKGYLDHSQPKTLHIVFINSTSSRN